MYGWDHTGLSNNPLTWSPVGCHKSQHGPQESGRVWQRLFAFNPPIVSYLGNNILFRATAAILTSMTSPQPVLPLLSKKLSSINVIHLCCAVWQKVKTCCCYHGNQTGQTRQESRIYYRKKSKHAFLLFKKIKMIYYPLTSSCHKVEHIPSNIKLFWN